MVLFTYSAVGTDANPVGSPWTTITGWGDVERASNALRGTVGSANGAYVSTVANQTDSYMEVTLGGIFVAGIGPMVRVQTGSASGYGIQVLSPGNSFHIFRYDSGSYNMIASGGASTFAAGDVWRLSVVGSQLTAYQNGVQVGTVSDSNYTSGRLGTFYWTQGTGGTAFEGGNFGAAFQAAWAHGVNEVLQ